MEGLIASENLRAKHNLKGVAGCLVDLMDVPAQLVTAADVVAGNQLFQVSMPVAWPRVVDASKQHHVSCIGLSIW